MNTFTKSALLGATMFTMVGAANAESHASSAMSFGLDANASIADNAMKVPTFSTLVAAVQAAGLADELMGDGDFTVFAPTDAAFAELPAGTVERLLAPGGEDGLMALLSAHVVPTSIASEYFQLAAIGNADIALNNQTIEGVAGGLKMDTIGNTDVMVMKDNGSFYVMTDDQTTDNLREAAKIIETDIMSSNGVIHVIDQVLQPRN